MKGLTWCPLCGQRVPQRRQLPLFWAQLLAFVLAGVVGFCAAYLIING